MRCLTRSSCLAVLCVLVRCGSSESSAPSPDGTVPSDAGEPDRYAAFCGNGILDAQEECEGKETRACTPACGSSGMQSCAGCAWGPCVAADVVCDDNVPCTTDDTCVDAVCVGTPMVCNAPPPEECHDSATRRTYAAVGVCVDGMCSYAPTDVVCDDGNACTDDFCTGGICLAAAVACTTPPSSECADAVTLRLHAAEGVCAEGVCVYAVTEEICDDSDPCTVDLCSGGVCGADPVVCAIPPSPECADGMTLRTYSAVGTCADGVCSYIPLDTICNDGDACTNDACVAGACLASPITCADANPCTDDSCNPASGCVFTPNTVACDDGNACTTADVCGGGLCAGAPLACTSPPSPVCANGTTRRTYAAIGTCSGGICSYSSTDATCNDGNACTVDSCSSDSCVFTPLVCASPPPTTCVSGPAVRTYTASGTCAGGACSYPFFDAACPIYPNTTPFCAGATCQTVCNAGYADCDSIASNGCEAFVILNNEACGTTCAVCANFTQYCDSTIADYCDLPDDARCTCVTCPGAWRDCNDTAADGCEINTATSIAHCGACGTICTAPAHATSVCAVGICGVICDDGYYQCGSACCLSWTLTTTAGAPSGRVDHTAVWTGSEMIIWGGGPMATNTGGRYDPITDMWVPTATSGAASARYAHTAVWTGSEMIVWGGTAGAGVLNTGGRYDPAIDTWTALPTSGAPASRTNHTAVWTGSEMIVWGGDDGALGVFNTGSRYNTGTNTWTATTTSVAPAGRADHTAIWISARMIVWGGRDASGTLLNSGNRYNPATNSWLFVTGSGAPSARRGYTAISSGSRMVIWGGSASSGVTNTGGRYDPSTDTWYTTSPTDAPTARTVLSGVWTGADMIVWGGWDGSSIRLDTGGLYDPVANTWIATTTVGAPAGREQHTAVWTGSEMIIWGGILQTGSITNTGGRYTPP